MNHILEITDLNKTYAISKGQEQAVLKNINLQIHEGEFVAVMGASGSGKSTLLYTISGMDRMTSGEVLFDGQNISSLSEKALDQLRQNKMGFIFQQIHLLKNLSMLDNIILSEYFAAKESRDSIRLRAEELMKKTGIAALADRDITQASGGQLQRVSICRALMNQPKIILGDEPTGALNSKATADIMELLGSINESGTTILLVTHDVKVAAKTERVLLMEDGEIVGEQYLGKYHVDSDDIKGREEKLSAWLLKMGI
ncbi:ABC transporter ATP-binding protein [Paenibacillus paridis]|uniref:ABC transporter ATP-binding protein n=1 Tax=Paenibacillus paridis TaxID=2583376 RepID=UPI00111E7C26|nr:ABC transporter ATP-binding protein [Paenibacillus paridis]